MVILHLVAPAAIGGLERVVQALALEQRAAGHDVHVAAIAATLAGEQALLRPLAVAGVDTHPVRVGARAYRRERAEVAKLCRRACPDVVHSHGYRPDVIDAGVARRLGLPTVTTVHGFTGGGWRNRLYEWLQRRAARRFAAVVAVSRPLADQLRAAGVPEERLAIVPNAWREPVAPLPREGARGALGLPSVSAAFHIGWVGRLSDEKGPDILIAALAQLRDVPFITSFVGDGPAQSRLRALGAAAGVTDRLRWHGAKADASRLFPAFDVFALSSRTEGTPIVLFEAMAAGVPIVAARVGGVEDVLSEAEALLVPAEDPNALAGALRAVYADPAAAARRARAARQRLATQFACGPWIERYLTVYRRVATPSAGASAT